MIFEAKAGPVRTQSGMKFLNTKAGAKVSLPLCFQSQYNFSYLGVIFLVRPLAINFNNACKTMGLCPFSCYGCI
jgi:hypothetical protein